MNIAPAEIVDRVFSFINDFAELQKLCLICHQWHQIGLHCIEKLLTHHYADKCVVSPNGITTVTFNEPTKRGPYTRCFSYLHYLSRIPSLYLKIAYSIKNLNDTAKPKHAAAILRLTNLIGLAARSIKESFFGNGMLTSLTNLQWLTLGAYREQNLPLLPAQLTKLRVCQGFYGNSLKKLSALTCLKRLVLYQMNDRLDPQNFTRLQRFAITTTLQELVLNDYRDHLRPDSWEQFVELLQCMTNLTCLKARSVNGIEQLSKLTSLRCLELGLLQDPKDQIQFTALTTLANLQSFTFEDKLRDVGTIFNSIPNLEYLHLMDVTGMKDSDFSTLSNLSKLTRLELKAAQFNLTINALDYLTSLTNLTLTYQVHYGEWLQPEERPANIQRVGNRFIPWK